MKKLIRDMDKGILIISVILLVFGLLNIVNASSQAIVIRYGTTLYYFFFKQALSILAGIIATIIILRIPMKHYPKIARFAYIGCLGLLIYLLLFGNAHQGSINWIKIGPITVQPSELAKPALILYVAVLFERFYKRLKSNKTEKAIRWTAIGTILVSAILYIGIIYVQKDLGTMIIISSIFGILFLLSPIRSKEKLQSIGLVAGLLVLIIIYKMTTGGMLTASQSSRLDFTDPCSKYEEGGYQICNGYIAINDGGLFGVGIGDSKQISYLPESHTDSIFAILSEEYGFLFCSFIFLLYLILLYRIFKLAGKTNSIKGKYICYGVGSYIAIHIIVNLGGLFGMMPLTGVPLPFLSYGGSFILALMVSLAMVQRVSIEHKRQKIVI